VECERRSDGPADANDVAPPAGKGGGGQKQGAGQAQEQVVMGTLSPAATANSDGGVAVLKTAAAVGAKNWMHPFFWAPFILIGNWQ